MTMKTLAIGIVGGLIAALDSGTAVAQLVPGPLTTDYGAILSPQAEGGSRYRMSAGTDLVYDDNVFRLPSGVSTSAVGASGRSNTSVIGRAFVQGNFDLPYSRQRFLAEVQANYYTFSNLRYLDYAALNMRGAWLWRAGDQLSGTLRYERLQGLADFIDVRPTVQNIRSLDTAAGSAEYALTPRWAVSGGLISYQAKNNDSGFKVGNVDQSTVELGLRYLATGTNYIRGFAASSKGRYPNRVVTATQDDRYTQNEFGVEALYALSERTSGRARLGYTTRHNPTVSARNFSGLTGRGEWIWGVSAITSVAFTARREIGVFEDVSTNFMVTNAIAIAPRWDVTPSIRLEAAYERWLREFKGDVVGAPAGQPQRSDTIDFLRLSAGWTATRNLRLRTGVQWSHRSSNLPLLDFTSNVLFVSAEYRL
jgi:exopolysaccharide biosynthesis operon protein EpsL